MILLKRDSEVNEEDMTHLSPARHEHINRCGRYRFDLNTLILATESTSTKKSLTPISVRLLTGTPDTVLAC